MDYPRLQGQKIKKKKNGAKKNIYLPVDYPTGLKKQNWKKGIC